MVEIRLQTGTWLIISEFDRLKITIERQSTSIQLNGLEVESFKTNIIFVF